MYVKQNLHKGGKMREKRLFKDIERLAKYADLIKDQIEKIQKINEKNKAEKEPDRRRIALFHQNALAVRYVSSLVARGVPLKKAVRLCAFKLNLDMSKVNDLFYMYSGEQKMIERRVNYLIVQKLHKKGFKARQIANICEFSEKYVFKVLKKVIEN